MSASSKPAFRGMLMYVIALVVLGFIVGAIYTAYGSPSNPTEPSAGDVIPKTARPAPPSQ